jgi:hypothetical protein
LATALPCDQVKTPEGQVVSRKLKHFSVMNTDYFQVLLKIIELLTAGLQINQEHVEISYGLACQKLKMTG